MFQIRRLKHNNVFCLVGACVDPLNIYIVSTYYNKGSLLDVLSNTNIKLDWIFKLSFASDIAKVSTFPWTPTIMSYFFLPFHLMNSLIIYHQNTCNKVIYNKTIKRIYMCGTIAWCFREWPSFTTLWYRHMVNSAPVMYTWTRGGCVKLGIFPCQTSVTARKHVMTKKIQKASVSHFQYQGCIEKKMFYLASMTCSFIFKKKISKSLHSTYLFQMFC